MTTGGRRRAGRPSISGTQRGVRRQKGDLAFGDAEGGPGPRIAGNVPRCPSRGRGIRVASLVQGRSGARARMTQPLTVALGIQASQS